MEGEAENLELERETLQVQFDHLSQMPWKEIEARIFYEGGLGWFVG